ncbi:hypothetical protein [Actinocrinis sp.]|uniref:hypothetical protein n=1 Tax=Actinocrinis sp. TaxID=1920516 RepID=UPI002D5B5F2A|nr:hypothetical protein [Actinocrinis sp.]HZP54310.1 hypothetical protein [Actinocrinis sp.]
MPESAAASPANGGPGEHGSAVQASSDRPGTVTAAAVLTALVAALLLGYGIYLVVAGLSGQPVLRSRAELGGAMFAIFGLGVGWVARGLLRCETWARTPALLTHLLVLAACYWMVQGDLYGEAVPTGLYGLAGIVLLFVPASHRVLSRDVR